MLMIWLSGFIGELHKAINIINKWSNEGGIPINFRKSGIPINIFFFAFPNILHNIVINSNSSYF